MGTKVSDEAATSIVRLKNVEKCQLYRRRQRIRAEGETMEAVQNKCDPVALN
jgi:hypothetical protein